MIFLRRRTRWRRYIVHRDHSWFFRAEALAAKIGNAEAVAPVMIQVIQLEASRMISLNSAGVTA